MADRYNFLNFTAIDFETSGLDYMTDQIIEAAVIRVRDGAPTMMFNTLVQLRADKHLPPKIAELTGHTEYDLEGGITEEQLAGALSWLIPDNELIVAYNAGFDMSFLNELRHRQDFGGLPNPFLDPLTIARDRSPYPHKLGDMCSKMGVPLDDAHSAQADTLALVDLVIAMHKEKDISEYVNVLGYRKKYGEPAWVPDHAVLKPQGVETIEHSKPRQNALKPKTNAIVTKNKRKKMVPDSNKEFAEMLPATIRVPKDVKERIDKFMASSEVKMTIGGFMIEDEEQQQEFEATMEYLTKVHKLDDNDISSELDNPGEAVIHIHIIPF